MGRYIRSFCIAKDCLVTLVKSRLAIGSPSCLFVRSFVTMPKMAQYTGKRLLVLVWLVWPETWTFRRLTTIISGVIQFWNSLISNYQLTKRLPLIQFSWYPSLPKRWKTLYDASKRRKYFATDRESFWTICNGSIFVEYQEVYHCCDKVLKVAHKKLFI